MSAVAAGAIYGSAASRSVSFEAAALLFGARLLLPRRSTTSVLRFLAGREPAVERPRPLCPAEALAAVRRAGNRIGAPCLPQSVALAALLRRHGADPAVVLGCRRQGPSAWDAHAWVELAGQRLEPVVDAGHSELARLSAANGWQIDAG